MDFVGGRTRLNDNTTGKGIAVGGTQGPENTLPERTGVLRSVRQDSFEQATDVTIHIACGAGSQRTRSRAEHGIGREIDRRGGSAERIGDLYRTRDLEAGGVDPDAFHHKVAGIVTEEKDVLAKRLAAAECRAGLAIKDMWQFAA